MSVNEQLHEKEPFSCQIERVLCLCAFSYILTQRLLHVLSDSSECQPAYVHLQTLHPSACSYAMLCFSLHSDQDTSLQHQPYHVHLQSVHTSSALQVWWA